MNHLTINIKPTTGAGLFEATAQSYRVISSNLVLKILGAPGSRARDLVSRFKKHVNYRFPDHIESEVDGDLEFILEFISKSERSRDRIQAAYRVASLVKRLSDEINISQNSNTLLLSLAGKSMVTPVLDRPLQDLREEVLKMVKLKKPTEGIPLYRSKPKDGSAVEFFLKYYGKYNKEKSVVIFAPDMKRIDERLLIALRNECRDGIALPIGDRSDRIDALARGDFADDADSVEQASRAIAFRVAKTISSGIQPR
jgi:hypothetical protein